MAHSCSYYPTPPSHPSCPASYSPPPSSARSDSPSPGNGSHCSYSLSLHANRPLASLPSLPPSHTRDNSYVPASPFSHSVLYILSPPAKRPASRSRPIRHGKFPYPGTPSPSAPSRSLPEGHTTWFP